VALLEDSDGIIDIDLPIEGDVNSPDFKYGKVVWQVIGNLFTKAVTSPFKLLGSMMGIETDTLLSIDFEPGSSALTPPQIEKLDRVTSMLAKRPKLMLSVTGAYDDTFDAYALKEAKLVQSALKRNKNLKIDSIQAMSVEMLESIAADSLDKKELSELKAAYKEKYPEEATFIHNYSVVLVEKLIPLQPLSPSELQLLGIQRGESIRNYFIKAGLDKRVELKTPDVTKDAKPEAIPAKLEIVTP
jgi:hypothetical protein